MIDLDRFVLVNPQIGTADWAFTHHRSLWHIVRPDDPGLTFCGRDPEYWDFFKGATFDFEADRDSLCKVCAKRFEAALLAPDSPTQGAPTP